MAYAKIDESGTVLERGLIRARVDMYLEPGDPGYDEHYVNVPDESSREFKAGYKGAVDAAGRPKDMDGYKSWLGSLPHVWRNNPFVCHFVRVGHEATTEQLAALAQEALDEFLAGRREGKTPNEVWRGKRRPVTLARNLDAAGQKKAEAKLATVKSLGTILAARGRRNDAGGRPGGPDGATTDGDRWPCPEGRAEQDIRVARGWRRSRRLNEDAPAIPLRDPPQEGRPHPGEDLRQIWPRQRPGTLRVGRVKGDE